jgi:Tfp pilus assembly protein PilX
VCQYFAYQTAPTNDAAGSLNTSGRILRWARARASAEHGFTMVIALGVLLVTSLLLTAAFYAVSGEIHVGTDNLAAKRAYAAASAGVQAYLYQMNQNPSYWETCSNNIQGTPVTVPGSSDGGSYTFQPIYANGNTSCTSNVINSLVDSTTGSIRLVFTGSAGAHPVVQRAIVVSFRMDSPLDFLWYTHFEAVDNGISGYSSCGVFYRNTRNSSCNIVWISGDTINGPAYTDDQYLINTGASPTIGRTPSDKIESSVPRTSNADICSGSNCQNAIFKGTPVYNAKPIPTPSDNSELLTDAQQYGNVFNGTTTVALNGTSATVTTCTTTVRRRARPRRSRAWSVSRSSTSTTPQDAPRPRTLRSARATRPTPPASTAAPATSMCRATTRRRLRSARPTT